MAAYRKKKSETHHDRVSAGDGENYVTLPLYSFLFGKIPSARFC